MRILVVDPVEWIRGKLVVLLRQLPHVTEVIETGTFADAVRLRDALRPDIVVLDLELPDACGLLPVRTLAPAGSNGIVLVYTALHSSASRTALLAAGAGGAFDKVLGLDDLLDRITWIAELRRPRGT